MGDDGEPYFVPIFVLLKSVLNLFKSVLPVGMFPNVKLIGFLLVLTDGELIFCVFAAGDVVWNVTVDG